MFLITPTLLENYHWYMKDVMSRQDFLDSLAKVKKEPTDLMKKGIEFENSVRKYCEHFLDRNLSDLVYREEYPTYIKIARIVSKGLWQVPCKKELQVEGENYLLYGRCDVIKDDTIFDIKYTENYYIGKYFSSSQWRIYLYCMEMQKFTYLASNGKEWWAEDYSANPHLEDDIKEKIWLFREGLKYDEKAEKLYLENWRAK